MSMLIALFKKRPDLTSDEFRTYYETRHAPFNLEHFAHLFAGYSRSYVAKDHGPGGSPVEVVTRIEFADTAGMQEMFTIAATVPGHQQAIADDEAQFMDRPETHLLLTADDLRTPMGGARTASPATITALIKRRPGMSHEEFRDYYESTHVPLVAGHFEHLITAYTRSYISADYANAGPEDRPVDVVSYIEFADNAAMQEMFALLAANPGIGEAINADEAKFMDRAAGHVLISTEREGFTAADRA